jgi:hypothetical protein
MKRILLSFLIFLPIVLSAQNPIPVTQPYNFQKYVLVQKYLKVHDTISCDSILVGIPGHYKWISPYTQFGINYSFTTPLSQGSGIVTIPAATGSVNGYLKYQDWNTFNNKLDSIKGITKYGLNTTTNLGLTWGLGAYTGNYSTPYAVTQGNATTSSIVNEVTNSGGSKLRGTILDLNGLHYESHNTSSNPFWIVDRQYNDSVAALKAPLANPVFTGVAKVVNDSLMSAIKFRNGDYGHLSGGIVDTGYHKNALGTFYLHQKDSILAASKQAQLISGTNIKTINGNTLLGSGDITTSGSMVYPGAGIATSSGSSWNTSLDTTINASLTRKLKTQYQFSRDTIYKVMTRAKYNELLRDSFQIKYWLNGRIYDSISTGNGDTALLLKSLKGKAFVINNPTANISDLMLAQVNGVSKFRVSKTGSVHADTAFFNFMQGATWDSTATIGQRSLATKETGQLGSEILSSSGWTSTGWTGTGPTFTHTTGNTTALSNNPLLTAYTLYWFTWTVTGRTAGSFSISFRGIAINSQTTSGTKGINSGASGSLTITPTTDFDGTITFSVKQISSYPAMYSIRDNTRAGVFDIRSSTASLFNQFSGYQTGQNNYTGYQNTASGYQSSLLNISGHDNTAFGYQALNQNTIGNTNTAVGSNSLSLNTTGGSNTGFGYKTLYTNTTGTGNTAVGSNSLSLNTTGGSNTGFGVTSLFSNTTGNDNTAIGYSALFTCSTGGDNTAIGYTPLYSLTTGTYNIGIGQTLTALTTGTYNLGMGYRAGNVQADGTTALTTPNHSIYIGDNTRGFNNSDNNSIVIGASAIGEGANKTVIGNSNTTGTHLYGNLTTGIVTGTQIFVSALNTAPSSASDTGTLGEIRITAGYIYVCIATNTWVRTALTSW